MTTSPILVRAASAWLVRLRDENACAADHEAFAAWLAADPRHREAFDLVQTSTLEVASLGRDLRAHLGARPKPRAAPMAMLAIAALACLMLSLAVRAPRSQAFETAIGEQRRIVLADGSTAELNTDTRLRVRYEEDVRRLELLRGEALFDVAHDPTRPFIVEADGQSVRALGTSFSVRVADQGVSVLVIEGVVSVADAHTAEVNAPSPSAPRVRAGERLDGIGAEIVAVAQTEIERDLSWRSGMLQFDGEPLSQAAREIARYTGARFAFEDEAARQIPVWAYVRANDLDAFLDGLERNVSDLRVERTGREVRFSSTAAGN